MMSKAVKEWVIFSILLIVFTTALGNVTIAWGSTGTAMPVSPGDAAGTAITDQACPTFSWSSVDGAVSYGLEVYEQVTADVLPYEMMNTMAKPVRSNEITAPALSWTPSSGECLNRGLKYVWYVRGVYQDGAGQWSGPKAFQVEASALSMEQKDAVQEVVKEYLIKEAAKTALPSSIGTNFTPGTTVTPLSDSVSQRGSKSGELRHAEVAGGSDVAGVIINGNMSLNDYDLMLRSGSDTNHGLGWYGSGKTFAGVNLDGPALYGCNNGALGTTCFSGPKIALQWDASGNVSVTNSLTYSAPKTRHWSVTGAAFQAYQSGLTWSSAFANLWGTTGVFVAPLHLPDGAVITKMSVRYIDNSASDFSVSINRSDMFGGAPSTTTVGSISTSGTSLNWQTGVVSSFTNATIDNSQYAYYVLLTGMASSQHILGGVIIEYTVTEPLP